MSLGDERGYGDSARSGGDTYGSPSHEQYGGTGQTRTRYADDGGAGATPRRGGRRSSSRGLVTVVGVVVLLVAAIAFANRSGGGSSSDGDGGNGGNGGKPGAAPTAASGTRPVEGKAGGIPTGYAHDEQGAQSAAANYAVALGSAEMFDTARRHEIVQTVYSPNVVAARLSGLDGVYTDEKFLTNIGLGKDGRAPTGETFVSRTIPVGTKVTSVDADQATVEIWYTSLFGLSGDSSNNPVSESWYTNTYKLTWTDNDWKVVDFQQKDGPVPVGRDQKASSADDMTRAVSEFGGFTYAR